MKVFNLLGVALLSLTPAETNYHALNDVAENATYVYSGCSVIEDPNNEYIGSFHYLSVYLEETIMDLVPLRMLATPEIISAPTTITIELSHITEKTYTVSNEINNGLKVEQGLGINFGGLGELKTQLSTNVSNTYKDSFTTSIQYISTKSVTLTVDGVNNKFGVYAYMYCAESAYKYYLKYAHEKYYNYNQQELYKTFLLDEDVDCHIYLPINPSRNVNNMFYFETLDDYRTFCDKWGL